MIPRLQGRRLVLTHSGYYGAVPPSAQEGDLCVCLVPFEEPLILRPVPSHSIPKPDLEDEIGLWANNLVLCRTVHPHELMLAGLDADKNRTMHIWPASRQRARERLGIPRVGKQSGIPEAKRKSPATEVSILHCSLVGLCHIYGVTPWNARLKEDRRNQEDGIDTDSEDEALARIPDRGTFASSVFVLH